MSETFLPILSKAHGHQAPCEITHVYHNGCVAESLTQQTSTGDGRINYHSQQERHCLQLGRHERAFHSPLRSVERQPPTGIFNRDETFTVIG